MFNKTKLAVAVAITLGAASGALADGYGLHNNEASNMRSDAHAVDEVECGAGGNIGAGVDQDPGRFDVAVIGGRVQRRPGEEQGGIAHVIFALLDGYQFDIPPPPTRR